MKDHIFELMINHHSYTQNVSSCEIMTSAILVQSSTMDKLYQHVCKR